MQVINPEVAPTGITSDVSEALEAAICDCDPDDPARIVDGYMLNWWDNPGVEPPSYAPLWDEMQVEDHQHFFAQVSLCTFCSLGLFMLLIHCVKTAPPVDRTTSASVNNENTIATASRSLDDAIEQVENQISVVRYRLRMGQQLATAYERAAERGCPLTPDANADREGRAEMKKTFRSAQDHNKAQETRQPPSDLRDDLPAHGDRQGHLRFSPTGLEDDEVSPLKEDVDELIYSD